MPMPLDLTDAEQKLVDAVTQGKLCDFTGGEDKSAYTLEIMQSWGPERTIRAEVLAELLVHGPSGIQRP
ncbi:MAG: hypothetical protein ACRCSF_00375, partial [Mycobacteriaceae bacterium]